MCDRVQILNRGRTVFAGNLSEIDSLEKTFFKLIYQGDPAMAEQEYAV